MLQPLLGKHLKMYHTFSNGSPYKNYDGIVADGSVRSGKTAAISILFISLVLRDSAKYPEFNSLLCGQTYDAVKNNVVRPYIMPLLDGLGLKHNDPRNGNPLIIHDGKQDIIIEIYGAKNSGSDAPISGRTFIHALADEATLMNKAFIKMLETRLSLEDSKFLLTTNPSKPDSHIKTDFIDNDTKKKYVHYHFTIDDNPYLADNVKDKLKRSFTGIFYDRYIRGLWVAVEGRVFGSFTDEHILDFAVSPNWEIYAGLDFGWNDPACIILIGYDRNEDTYYIFDEIVESNITTRTMGLALTGNEIKTAKGVKRLVGHELMPYNFRKIIAGHEANQSRQESSGLSNKRILENEFGLKNMSIKFHYLDFSIQAVNEYINGSRLYVHPRCNTVIRDFNNYMYPEKDGEFYGEKPDASKTNHKYSHTMDAIRYVIDTVTPVKALSKVKVGFN